MVGKTRKFSRIRKEMLMKVKSCDLVCGISYINGHSLSECYIILRLAHGLFHGPRGVSNWEEDLWPDMFCGHQEVDSAGGGSQTLYLW